MPARLFFRTTDLDTLWGLDSTLPVDTIDGGAWTSAATTRDRRRTLRRAGETLRVLRALRVAGTAHVHSLEEQAGVDPSIIDTVLEVRVELTTGGTLHLFPHRAGGTAAAFFAASPQRVWVLDLLDLADAATTLLTMTAEHVGNAAWAAERGVSAQAVRMVSGEAGTWRLGVVTSTGFVVAEPNGAVVGLSHGHVHARTGEQDERLLARAAADLARESASLLAAA